MSAVSNWARVPIGVIVMTFTKADAIDIWQRCNACGERFLGTFLNDEDESL